MTPAPLSILLVDDDAADIRQLEEFLGELNGDGFALATVSNLIDATKKLAAEEFDVVIVDLCNAAERELVELERLQEVAPQLPVIALTDLDDEERAALAARSNAHDHLVRENLSGPLLRNSIRYAIERHKEQQTVAKYQAKLKASFLDYQRVLYNSADGVLVVDQEGCALFGNPAACAMLGLEIDELPGKNLALPKAPGTWTEIDLGNDKVAELLCEATQWGGQPASILTLREVTARKQSQDQLVDLAAELEEANSRLEKLAYVDPLTGLLNRRGLEKLLWVEQNRALRETTTTVALFVDCDDFKTINDSMGYSVGDRVITAIGKRLQSMLRGVDSLARVGGDEFLIILPNTHLAEGIQVAERIRMSIADLPLPISGKVSRITVSIGVATVPYYQYAIDSILSRTDAALNSSKREGKNRVSSSRSVEDKGEGYKLPDMRELLVGDKGVRVVAQKIMALQEEELVGFELLIRGPKGIFEMPDDFFRLCMEQKVLSIADLRCVEACLVASKQHANACKYNINLFPSTLLEVPTDHLCRMFEETGHPHSYCIEISEQQFIGDPYLLRDRILALRECGLRIAIDDVGFGRSSLETLLILEPDVVKIDRKYVSGIANNPGRVRALQRLLHVSQVLGAEAVAEGIETREDLAKIIEIGVTYGQGYLWGKPAPLEEQDC